MKKGFFFSMDAFFAVMIFTLILVSIYGYFINIQELRQQYFYSEDLLDVFTNTKMGEIGDLEFNKNLELLKNWKLINEDLTIMDQMILLNERGYSNYSQWIFYNLTSDFLGGKYGSGFSIGLEEIFESDRNVTALVSRQRYVSGSELI